MDSTRPTSDMGGFMPSVGECCQLLRGYNLFWCIVTVDVITNKYEIKYGVF